MVTVIHINLKEVAFHDSTSRKLPIKTCACAYMLIRTRTLYPVRANFFGTTSEFLNDRLRMCKNQNHTHISFHFRLYICNSVWWCRVPACIFDHTLYIQGITGNNPVTAHKWYINDRLRHERQCRNVLHTAWVWADSCHQLSRMRIFPHARTLLLNIVRIACKAVSGVVEYLSLSTTRTS